MQIRRATNNECQRNLHSIQSTVLYGHYTTDPQSRTSSKQTYSFEQCGKIKKKYIVWLSEWQGKYICLNFGSYNT